MNDGGVDLAPGANLRAETVPSVGWLVYYNHAWSDKWSSSIGYSEHRQNNTGGQLATAFHKGSYSSVNLLYATGEERHDRRRVHLGPTRKQDRPRQDRLPLAVLDEGLPSETPTTAPLIKIVDYPLLVFVASLLFLSFCIWVGARVLRRWSRPEESTRDDFGIVVGATLTLLGLLVGFGFSMAVGRYDQRKNLEEAEANAIGTEYLRADLLPAADADKVRALLHDYFEQRILFYTVRDPDRLREIDARTTALQTEMWSAVAAPAKAAPTPTSRSGRHGHERRAEFAGLHTGRLVEPDSPRGLAV